MPRENQIVIIQDTQHYACTPCSREFNSKNSLLQHSRDSSDHRSTWCDRCEWLFIDPDARQRHLEDSSRHWICKPCDEDKVNKDFETKNNLIMVSVTCREIQLHSLTNSMRSMRSHISILEHHVMAILDASQPIRRF